MRYRSKRWVWAGRAVFGVVVVALVIYLAAVGLDKADKLASIVSAVFAVVALGVSRHFEPRPDGGSTPDPHRVEDSGDATATRGGQANTGVQTAGDSGRAHVTRSGNASADGPGSIANTGFRGGPHR